MTNLAPIEAAPSDDDALYRSAPRGTRLGWVPSWPLITTKHLELRKRRGLLVAAVLLTVGFPVLVLGLRLVFHAVDSKSYGPAGDPGLFSPITDLMAEFGFIVAAALGAAAGSTDLSDGVFRQLVITGRSRVALYLARIPAGLAILAPLVAAAFTMLCLVTSYEGPAAPTSVSIGGANVPAHLTELGLQDWAVQHPGQAALALSNVGPPVSAAQVRSAIPADITSIYHQYTDDEVNGIAPSAAEMADVGSWLLLEIGIGFLVGLGLGSLSGQRTVPIIALTALEIIITPALATHVIPYFIDGQRLVVGVAMAQLRPAALGSGATGHGLLGASRALQIPPMPTWAMVCVIVGWIVGWTALGAWRMATRDA